MTPRWMLPTSTSRPVLLVAGPQPTANRPWAASPQSILTGQTTTAWSVSRFSAPAAGFHMAFWILPTDATLPPINHNVP